MSPLRTALSALALACAGGAAAAQAPALGLGEVYALALKASESIAVGESAIREAEGLYRAALGSSLPELSARLAASWEDGPKPGRRASATETDGGLRLSWGSLNGYRQLAAVRAAKAGAAELRYARERAEQLLLAEVALAFFGHLQASENLASTRELIELADKRVAELRARVRVGRTREADALGQEFQVATLRSQLEESARQLAARGDLLSFLAKAPVTPAPGGTGALAEPQPLESYLARAETRPEVSAARMAVEGARALVAFARAERFPQLGLDAGYHALRSDSLAGRRWDAGLTASVPLWDWRSRAAEASAAEEGLTQEELAHALARRAAELDIRNAHRDLGSAQRQLELRRAAVELARRDYELQRADERRGLVTSIEALESLNRLNAARLAFNSALLQARLAALTLELSAGAKPGELDLR